MNKEILIINDLIEICKTDDDFFEQISILTKPISEKRIIDMYRPGNEDSCFFHV